jgi:hypothetical protein
LILLRITVQNRLSFTAELATTAMGIMPHEDVDTALEVVLSTDIPFWPQLPRLAYHETCAGHGTPLEGIDEEARILSTAKDSDEIPAYLEGS